MNGITHSLLIAKRDFKAYFKSPMAYVLMFIFSLVLGFMFFSIFKAFIGQFAQAMEARGYGMMNTPKVTDALLRPLFGNLNVVLLFLFPFITMRSFAEERRLNTIELLFTSPVTWLEIVVGKYLSALGVLGVLVLLTVPFIAMVGYSVQLDWGVVVFSYLGTFLMIGTYIGIGLWCSSLTESQVVAGVLTFGVVLLGWIIKWAAFFSGPVLADVLTYLSIVDHYDEFSRGVLNSKDVVFFGSAIGLWIFLTYKSLQSFSWRS